MKTLSVFYFSGTGNTRFVAEETGKRLAEKYEVKIYDIGEEKNCAESAFAADKLLFAFPVYGSSPPVPMRRFIYANAKHIEGKEIFVIATQYMFSGDGAASLGRTIEKLGGKGIGAEHVNMPNNLADCTALKIRNDFEIAKTLKKAEKRIDSFSRKILCGKRFRRGFNPVSHAVGYFCQRKWWRKGENAKKSSLLIHEERCIGCGICAAHCPVKNIIVEGRHAKALGNCAFCYRCVNLCPNRAISLFGKSIPEKQYKGPQSRKSLNLEKTSFHGSKNMET